MEKVDLDAILKDLKDTYGEDEDDYKLPFYGVIRWEEVKAMIAELKASRKALIAVRDWYDYMHRSGYIPKNNDERMYYELCGWAFKDLDGENEQD